MYLRIATIFRVLNSAVIYILNCLEHGAINIRVISCRNERGGVFGERVCYFSLRNLNVTMAFHGRKNIYCSAIQNTRKICDIIGKQAKQYWKRTVSIRYRFNRLKQGGKHHRYRIFSVVRQVTCPQTSSLVLYFKPLVS